MLTLTSEKEIGGGRYRDHVVLGARFRCQLMERDHVVYDTRYLPRAEASPDNVHVFWSMRGHLDTADHHHAEPVAYLLTSAEFESTTISDRWFRTWGAPSVTLDIVLPRDAVARPAGIAHGPLELAAPIWAAAERLCAAFTRRRPVDDALVDVLGAMATDGFGASWLRDDMNITLSEPLARIWAATQRRYAELDVSTTLLELAADAGISVAQVARDFKAVLDAFPYLGTGFREILRTYRLRLAVMFLSATNATKKDVAHAVGYGSLAAMTRAFQDAGMPSPADVLAACRYDVVAAARIA